MARDNNICPLNLFPGNSVSFHTYLTLTHETITVFRTPADACKINKKARHDP
jgi:hypothetical protein